ncbi:MAG: hypothetical protein GXP25_06355 [Planctomycetes bacterium]|nr:hypothetical protein [Planctomycetota bacterium]
MKNIRSTLVCLVAFTVFGSPLDAKELGDLRAVYGVVREQVRARKDCMVWYDFTDPAAQGLKFVPGPGKGVLSTKEGRWPGQKAVNIFHGKLMRKAIHIPDSGFTLCCWLRVNDLEKVDRHGYKRTAGGVMATGSGYYNGWRLLVTPGSRTLTFALGRPEVGARRLSSSGHLTPGEWHHVAVTWDHETLAMWIDGKLRSETVVTMAYNGEPKAPGFRIGECDSGLGVLNFDIADVGLFSTALPADVLKRLGDPDLEFRKELTRFVTQITPPSGVGGEEAYRRQFAPLLALSGCDDSPTFRTVKSMARLRVAESFVREKRIDEARRVYTELAGDGSAPLHYRARAMLALGDLHRDAKNYTAARQQYEKTRDFFVAKHEAFRVEAVLRLKDVETLADGAPFRDQRQRRIDRISHPALRLFVAPNGDDTNPGTEPRPFRTLERARDAVRELKKKGPLPKGGVAVMLKGGVYRRETESFALTAEDSGTIDAPIIYQAVPGRKPILRGGRAVSGFKPLTDPVGKQRIPAAAQAHVLQVDLKAAGVKDFGKLRPRGKAIGIKGDPDVPAHLELFFDARPMSLARWPNDTPKMSERFTTVDLGGQETVRDHGRSIARESNFFSYTNPRQDAWAREPDAWVFGCWQYMFYGCYRKITRVDTEKRQIHIDRNRKTPYELKRREFALGAPYQGINLLCELDSPGEWYLDRASGILFFWPPSDVTKGEAVVSVLEKPIITLDGASHVVLRGLTLEAGRRHGVVIKGGEGVLLAGCVIRNMGVTGVIIDKGVGHEVIGCDLAYLGDAGVKVEGGDVEKLIPSGHLVENCHIHHYARWNRVGYQPAVAMAGVGNRVSHCLVHNAPHQAFLVDGNDNIVEYSEIHDVVDEAGDAGAYYMYGGVSKNALLELGQVVRYNYWHDLPANETFKKVASVGRRVIYIDSFNSNITVYGNIFQRYDDRSGAVFFGACDNRIENNIFCRCFSGVNLSDRTWLYGKVNKPPNFVIDAYLAKAAANPIWARRYPWLKTFPPQAKDTSVFLAGNVVARNIASKCETFIFGSNRTIALARIEQNWIDGDLGFKDPDNGDFALDPKSPVFVACGFEPLPLDKMGLYNDELRANWPVHHESGVYETLRLNDGIKRKPVAEMPVCQARQRKAPITIDGRLDPAEWDGLNKTQAAVLKRTPSNKPTKARPSYVWLRWDEESLYIGLLNELNPGETPKPKAGKDASWWKGLDMAEIIFEGPFGKNSPDWWPKDKKHGPIFYLLGDCAGLSDAYSIADLPPSRAEGLRSAVQYATASEPGRWTAEWRIPLAALCLDPKTAKGCCFNIGVLKPGTLPDPKTKAKPTASEKWAVWCGTMGANWKVWNAGRLQLKGQ